MSDARSQQPAVNSLAAGSWLAPEQFARFRDLLAGYSGVYLDIARQRWLEQSLARRLAATGENLAGYEQRLSARPDELRRLAELVLNHETLFFRNGPHFQALRTVLLPELHRRKPAGAPIRIWSAGCSTGEEAYSLAITALEALGQPLARPVEIWATDLSEPALQKARAGVYRGRTLQNLPEPIAQRYFTSHADHMRVGDAARALVRFEPLNLLDPFPRAAEGVDLIFCQNVTIYFQLATCRQLIARFYECLPAGGMLFLGFSETLWNVFDRFETREVAGAYVYVKSDPEPAAPKPPARATAPLGRLPGTGALLPTRDRANRRPAAKPAQAASHDQIGGEQLARGHALLAESQHDAALEALRLVPPQSAAAPVALTLVARIHADRGDLELAAAEAQRAIEINALNSEAQLLLGIIYSRQEQWPSAIRQLERARYLDPASALASFHLAEAYRQAARADKASAEYRNALQKLNRHPPGTLLDGVAVEWLRETCQRQIEYGRRSFRGKQGA